MSDRETYQPQGTPGNPSTVLGLDPITLLVLACLFKNQRGQTPMGAGAAGGPTGIFPLLAAVALSQGFQTGAAGNMQTGGLGALNPMLAVVLALCFCGD